MAGQCLVKLAHSCGSSDGLQVFENDDNTLSGYCFACSTYVAHPYGEPKNATDIPKAQRLGKTKEEIQKELDEVASYPIFDLPERKLRKDALEHYGVKIGLSEEDGKTPKLVYLPYTKDGKLVRYKVRLIAEKRMWSLGSESEPDLFGWEQAVASGVKKLIITEGEYDAIALYKILKVYNKGDFDIPAVVSIPNGASGAAKDLARLQKKIKKHFKEVALCFDNDEAGKKAVDDVKRVFPDAKVIELPAKDANECLMNGLGKAAWKACTFNASSINPTRLIKGSSLREAAMKKPKMGISWPWKGFTELTRGIRRQETYYFGAGVKMGKSELVNAIGEHLIVNHDLPVFFCKPEEDPAKSYQMLVSKAAGKIFHDPKIEFDEEAFLIAEKLIGDKAIITDSYQFVNWDSLKDDIRYAVKADGVKDIIIDPVTCFTNNLSATETNEFLVQWAAELAAMSKDLDFTSYIFCHLKAPLNGEPHERGGEVLSTQFTGSRAMMRSCHMMVGLEGNKNPELPEYERNVRKLKILEDRNLGVTGIIQLYWDSKTGLFNEMVT